jgi:hypothetical protein
MTRTRETRPGNGTGTGIKVNGQQTRAERTPTNRRAAALRGCAAAYHHLGRAGLLSHLVVDELQAIIREAAS